MAPNWIWFGLLLNVHSSLGDTHGACSFVGQLNWTVQIA
jgi:hypothetical protein